MILPRLLLITNATLNNNDGGINRTLYNLLDFYDSDKFMLYTDHQLLMQLPTSAPFNKNVLSFNSIYLPYCRNIVGNYINEFIHIANLEFIDKRTPRGMKKIIDFNPEVVLVCPNSAADIIVSYKITKILNRPYFVYFMDDWLHNINKTLVAEKINNYVSELLTNASGWLMISDELKDVFIKRYNLPLKPCLTIINPVDIKEFDESSVINKNNFRIAYAGAVWPIHYDAIILVAKAVSHLRSQGENIELILHTPQTFWDLYKKDLEHLGVTYGGFIKYSELNNYLQQADLLLVPSSFSSEMEPVIRTTVQTKITDYMASGRPIFACGPYYSASNKFVNHWKCGVNNYNSDVNDVAHMLNNLMTDTTLGEKGITAYNVARENFNKLKVHQEFTKFIYSSK